MIDCAISRIRASCSGSESTLLILSSSSPKAHTPSV